MPRLRPGAAGLLARYESQRSAGGARPPASLLAPGSGLVLPELSPEHYDLGRTNNDAPGAQFAIQLLRAGVIDPQLWERTRDVQRFLNAAVSSLAGEHEPTIDQVFCLQLSLASSTLLPGASNPDIVAIALQTGDPLGWVNVMPALDLLAQDHPLLPTLFYHWLVKGLDRWFYIFDVQRANHLVDMEIESFEEEEDWRQEECRHKGKEYVPEKCPWKPVELPACVQERLPESIPDDIVSLCRTKRTQALMRGAKHVWDLAHALPPPQHDQEACELFGTDDSEPLAIHVFSFGEHDTISELCDQYLQGSGEITHAPWPVFGMDPSRVDSVREAFTDMAKALEILGTAARVIRQIPGHSAINDHA